MWKCSVCGATVPEKCTCKASPQVSKPFFKAEDFFGIMGADHRVHPQRAADRANAKRDAELTRLREENAKLAEANRVWQRAIGIACLKHDLTHHLVCGHCADQLRTQLKSARDALREAGDVICSEYCGSNGHGLYCLSNSQALDVIDASKLLEKE